MNKKHALIIGVSSMLLLALTVSGLVFAQADENSTATPWMGIGLVETDDGIVVQSVSPGSPAAAAAVVIGDVIVSLDGESVGSAEDLVQVIQDHVPGDVVTLSVLRNGIERAVEIELGSKMVRSRSERADRSELAPIDAVNIAEMLLRVDLEETDEGYVVNDVGPLSTFELEEGDVITAINGQAVADWDWSEFMSELDPRDETTVTLDVQRGGETITLEGSLLGHGWLNRDFGQHFGVPGRGRGSDDARRPFDFGRGRDSDDSGRLPNSEVPGTSESTEPTTEGSST
jgi:C-terminal processing protease CtpA/Prc